MEIIVIAGLMIAAYWYFKQKPFTPAAVRATLSDEPLDAAGWDDNEEAWVQCNPKPIQARLQITYKDSAGETTKRTVDAKECDTTNPAGYLFGYCHLRNDVRTFRLDRIQRAIDLDTGEVINDIPAYAALKYNESPTASLDKLLDQSMDAIRAMFYIGKADGRFTTKEKQVFLEYCQTATNDANIGIGQINDLCRLMEPPTKQSFRLICGRLAKLEQPTKTLIFDTVQRMIATEKTISGEELEAMEYMRKRLGIEQ